MERFVNLSSESIEGRRNICFRKRAYDSLPHWASHKFSRCRRIGHHGLHHGLHLPRDLLLDSRTHAGKPCRGLVTDKSYVTAVIHVGSGNAYVRKIIGACDFSVVARHTRHDAGLLQFTVAFKGHLPAFLKREDLLCVQTRLERQEHNRNNNKSFHLS